MIKEMKIETDVKETIEECLKISDSLDGVIILALNKEGQQLMSTSNMSMFQKLFLKAFLDAWSVNWFLED
jgi:hypothetical protein